MNIPESLQYTKDHEWVQLNGKIATVGITDFAQGELGDIVFIEVPVTGNEIKQGDVFGTVEAVKTVSDLFMPLSGKIIEVNPLLESKPEAVNSDPYQEGWIIKIEATNPNETLLSAAEYNELIAR